MKLSDYFDIKCITRFIDKFRSGNQLTQWGSASSKWFVEYNDGGVSVSMHYSTAKTYANIFGGKVRHVSERKGKDQESSDD